jgi:hypothetical protein
MEPSRRDRIVLGVLVAVLLVVSYRSWRAITAPVVPAPAGRPAAAAQRATRGLAPLKAPQVHLTALDAAKPAPQPVKRDLFRFAAPAAPAHPAAAVPPRAQAPPPMPGASAPTAPAGPPPIALKFIGIVEATTSSARIAVLSDGRGQPLYGREGEAVDGRYRILHIGEESIEMAYLDGRGRQTIRLSGR